MSRGKGASARRPDGLGDTEGRHESRGLRLGRRAEARDDLRTAVTELTSAIDAGAEYLPEAQVLDVEKVLKRASERLSLAGRHTIVALAGATGSGKSSLFNALVGEPVSRTGVIRPTTSHTGAAIWGADSATDLLDWLRIRDRHRVGAAAAGSADGLVLLDLPDIDSTQVVHRAEADRILAMTDVYVWVTDPQKYADAVLHEEYLAPARHRGAVTIVVLNQIDRLGTQEAQSCLADLRRLLTDDGLPQVSVIACSATTGEGTDVLFAELAGAVAAAEAARARLLADVQDSARRLRAHVADETPKLPAAPSAALVDALADAAGVPTVLSAVEADHRRRAIAATGWPVTRWIRGLRPDPLKRLRLDAARDRTGEVTPLPQDVEQLVRRSSLPQATPAARASVDRVTRRLADDSARGLPLPWADAVRRAARPDGLDLADALDQAIVATELPVRRPLWWSAVGGLQWLLVLAAIVGIAWLGLLAGLGWLQLPPPPLPSIGRLPVPTLLAVGGLVGGVLLASISRALAAAGARRRAGTLALRLRDAIGTVADAHLMGPVRLVLQQHEQTRAHLDAAAEA